MSSSCILFIVFRFPSFADWPIFDIFIQMSFDVQHQQIFYGPGVQIHSNRLQNLESSLKLEVN
jgi:hypothetical protein